MQTYTYYLSAMKAEIVDGTFTVDIFSIDDRKLVQASTFEELGAIVDAWAQELADRLGCGVHAYAAMPRGARKPRGFDKWRNTRTYNITQPSTALTGEGH
jgi:hypothetical protein